jgi:hypothetical protein
VRRVAILWLGRCRRHIFITNLLAWAIEMCAALLVWIFVDVSDAFPTVGTYILFWLTLFFASTAAINSVFAAMSAHDSLYVANEGLELTRGTQRPFLNVTVELPFSMNVDRAIVQPEVQNTGNLPADSVLITCNWHIQDSDTRKEQQLRKEKDNPTIIFPGEKIVLPYTIEGQEAVAKRTHSGSRVEVIIEYENRLTSQKCHTKRTFKLAFIQGATNTAQAIPVPEEDYWD